MDTFGAVFWGMTYAVLLALVHFSAFGARPCGARAPCSSGGRGSGFGSGIGSKSGSCDGVPARHRFAGGRDAGACPGQTLAPVPPAPGSTPEMERQLYDFVFSRDGGENEEGGFGDPCAAAPSSLTLTSPSPSPLSSPSPPPAAEAVSSPLPLSPPPGPAGAVAGAPLSSPSSPLSAPPGPAPYDTSCFSPF
jgi:hypothetical protein